MDHLSRGHEQICEEIHRGGNAEQHHANKKYEEAVAVAVEACAEDTKASKGQTCYICLEAVHSRTGEGLVRGCACRGTAGFAHVSCLARQAEVAVERGGAGPGFGRWDTCGLCEQGYHGVVACALGWACWKTYVGRPETDHAAYARLLAMTGLGSGLSAAGHHEDELSVKEAVLSEMRRLGTSEDSMLHVQSNLAITYRDLGRLDEALSLRQQVYYGQLKLKGEEHKATLFAALNYADSLNFLRRFEEAKPLLRRTIPVARRVLGEGCDVTLKMRGLYAQTLYRDPDATLDDLREAVTTLEDTERIVRRVLGCAHPLTKIFGKILGDARAALRARETPPPGSA